MMLEWKDVIIFVVGLILGYFFNMIRTSSVVEQAIAHKKTAEAENMRLRHLMEGIDETPNNSRTMWD